MLPFNQHCLLPVKKYAVIFILLLFCANAYTQVFTVDTMMKNGERSNRINLVYLSDGYKSTELNTFMTNAQTINDAVFSQTPFAQYKNYFNAFAVKVPSNASGAKHPGNATDEYTSGNQPIINPDNYFQSTFDFYLIHRLLVPQNYTGLYNVLASNLPDYDQAFIVVNSPYYGGSGGTYATASTDASSTEVAIHEIGHSFAGLADEYWAGLSYAAEKPNMTEDKNPATIKWKSWLNINNVGIFPYGTVPPQNLWYRPHQFCKMQYLNYPFCAVCTETFVDRIHGLVNMIDSYSPVATSFTLSNTNDVSFSVANIETVPSTTHIYWYLNGSSTPFATDQNTVAVPFTSFVNGTNTIQAEVVDNTNLSKSYLPTAGYSNAITWTISTGTLPVTLGAFNGKINAQKQGVLEWQVLDAGDVKSFDLERSKDGTSFIKLATVKGEPNRKNYFYTDNNLLLPYGYYRLKMFDKDGKSTYSKNIRLANPFDKFSYKVYQDAATHTYRLVCMLANEANVQATVTSMNGALIATKNFGRTNTQVDYEFNLSSSAAGIYFLNIYIDNIRHTVKLAAN